MKRRDTRDTRMLRGHMRMRKVREFESEFKFQRLAILPNLVVNIND